MTITSSQTGAFTSARSTRLPRSGFVQHADEVAILWGGQEIARHPRHYGEGVFVADPLHYLALIEMKPNALD